MRSNKHVRNPKNKTNIKHQHKQINMKQNNINKHTCYTLHETKITNQGQQEKIINNLKSY